MIPPRLRHAAPRWIACAGAVCLIAAVAGAEPVRTVELAPGEWPSIQLGRAVDDLLHRDYESARARLERIDLEPGAFPEVDRAAFLLGFAYLELGDTPAFLDLAAHTATWTEPSGYLRWIAYQRVLLGARGASDLVHPEAARERTRDFPFADLLLASGLLESGRAGNARELLRQSGIKDTPAGLYLLALAETAEGVPAGPTWERLAAMSADTPLERELVAAGGLRAAVAALERGENPERFLTAVPEGTSYTRRARMILAVVLDEREARDRAIPLLESLEASAVNSNEIMELSERLGGFALEEHDAEGAARRYVRADSAWTARRAALVSWAGSPDPEALWARWDEEAFWPRDLTGDLTAVREAATRFADQALDLDRTPKAGVELTTLSRYGGPRTPWDLIPPPPAAVRDSIRIVYDALRSAERVGARLDHRIAERRETLARTSRYLDHGLDHQAVSRATLRPLAARIDSLVAALDWTLAELDAVTDDAAVRYLARTREFLTRTRAHLIWIDAMRHFQIEGPNRERAERMPEGIPSPEDLLREEEALARRIDTWSAEFGDRVPGLLARSLADHWTPGFVDLAHALREQARAQRARLDALESGVREARNALESDPELLALLDAREAQSALEDSLAAVHRTLRDAAARNAVGEALARHDARREAIDYGLTAAAYERSVQTLEAAGGFRSDSTSVAVRDEAQARLESFLAAYPDSPARAETRFRLADLYLVRSKEAFEARMRRYLDDDLGSVGRGDRSLVPFVDYGSALELYRDLLAQDPDYVHRDAVLFNLGMILSDQGNPGAVPLLAELVANYPDSPFRQEAHLRLADDRFDQGSFRASIPHYEEAARGENADLVAIALYRMGWAHFSEDRFPEAADAFRRLIDHYASGRTMALKTDLRNEAENYFVHALARAGGAPFFETYFEGIGYRPYEARTLAGLARLLREFSLYAEAIEADRLFLERFPDDPSALAGARRIVESYETWNHAAQARDARLTYATRFAPGTRWWDANPSDSLRAEARDFSWNALRTVALYHHHRARAARDDRADWTRARELYEILLKTWPGHEASARIHLYAGEAAGKLEDYEDALHHYETAVYELYASESRVSTLDLPNSDVQISEIILSPEAAEAVLDADWQRVAISDAWYRSTVAPTADGERGIDSLAVKVRSAAEGFVTRHGNDPRAPDALWRSANLALAHEWLAPAAISFDRMTRRFPGDARAPRAAALAGDALYQDAQFAAAQAAYEKAVGLAQQAHDDTLAKRVYPLVPLCAYRHAEQVAETSGPAAAAPLFQNLALGWPDYEHAGLALYRAGLGHHEAGRIDEAVTCWNRLITTYPDHEYARDAHLQIAAGLEESGQGIRAAEAYQVLSETYPEDAEAPNALLKAADLLAAAGDSARADTLRLSYVDRFPEDLPTVMEILETGARRDLAGLGQDAPISTLLERKPPSLLARYLSLAVDHPDLASGSLQGRVQFLKGEEAFRSYRELAITRPVDRSIAKKKTQLEAVMARYGGCAAFGDPEWARAAAYRIGEALVGFGDALLAGERPTELTGDDLLAYDEVLQNEAWTFFDQGERVWSEILRETRTVKDDPGGWIARTQETLWPRLADRFFCMPEVVYPVLAADRPGAPSATPQAGLPSGSDPAAVAVDIEPEVKDD